MSENTVDGLRAAAAVLDAQGIGLLVETEQGPRIGNAVMSELVHEFGTLGGFLATEHQDRVRVHGVERSGEFRVRCVEIEGNRLHLVQELPQGADTGPGWLSSLPERSPHPIYRLGPEGRLAYANTAGQELLDYGLDGRQEELETRLRGALEAVGREAEGVELEIGGRIVAFVIGYVEGAQCVDLYGLDVTDRKHAEAALRRSEERFRTLLETAPDAILIINGEGAVDYANEEAEHLFESGRPLVGRAVGELVPGGFLEKRLERVIAGEGADSPLSFIGAGVVTGLRGEGREVRLEVRTSPYVSAGTRRLIAVLRDVTEREHSAAEIRRLNSHLAEHVAQLTSLNRELESFSYSVSHDLRGPLRSIVGFSSILLEEYAERLDEDGRGFLKRIIAAGHTMGELIEGLLRLSRVSRTELRIGPVDLGSIAQSVAQELRAVEPDHPVRLYLPESVQAQGDRSLLMVLLENLLGNAWKFTRGRPDAQVEVGVTEHEGRQIYYVRDNGAGFDMNYASRLFRPFERLHSPGEFPGTGIGLATAERVVHRHGGEIWAEGEPGEGATFYFTLSGSVTSG
jgi:PAS domain S-box-containing protein